MRPTSLEEIARWCGGVCSAGTTVSGMCLDSRTAVSGDLFFAVKGQNVDGHSYIESAAKNGASAAVVTEDGSWSIPTVKVADAVRAAAEIAAAYRKTLGSKFCAVTGSVGKTTTKEMIHTVLSAKYNTGKSTKNHNNLLGLSLSLLAQDDSHEAVVLELGMNHFGELSELTAMALPDVAVITNIGTMHIEHLGSREGILKAKLEILEGLASDGIAILNGNEPLLRNAGIDHEICWFGFSDDCHVRGENYRETEIGCEFDAVVYGSRQKVCLPVEGRHNVMNALSALAVGYRYNVPVSEMAEALAEFRNTGMRQNIYKAKGCIIIEDCYNAGPESTAASLSVLASKSGKRIAVLGSMLELGDHSRSEHEKIGHIAAQSADILLTFGDDMAFGAAEAKKLGMEAYAYTDKDELAEMLRHTAKPGDTILFKGSRGMKMEQILEAFLK
ncbi:MAG: UDP-N-acetylmuramoyl-tripeptide--D-alanyl-D-alanine ligase [Ruminococcaceae bacterium]|nr:UDP-N-acetylmuramoyl-tripeptide--D-alanyl-D-alanine ligase [Oscillospiraceae bacterium]